MLLMYLEVKTVYSVGFVWLGLDIISCSMSTNAV